MNQVAADLLQPAYEWALRDKGPYAKKSPVRPLQLAHRLDRLHVTGITEAWSARTLAAVSTDRLRSLAPRLYRLINQAGQGWEGPDEGHEVEYAADAIAALRFLNRDKRGKIEWPEYTTRELEAWLEPRLEPQMSLFAEVG